MGESDEGLRLAALREYRLLETPPDEELASVVRVAAAVAGVPTATINLVEADRQCQLVAVGIGGRDSARQDALCDHVVRSGSLVHVPDARLDSRFAQSPWVTGVLAAVRLYAAAPLITPEGHVLGTLCVFDTRPGELTADQLARLEDLAGIVVALFERRRQARTTLHLAPRRTSSARSPSSRWPSSRRGTRSSRPGARSWSARTRSSSSSPPSRATTSTVR